MADARLVYLYMHIISIFALFAIALPAYSRILETQVRTTSPAQIASLVYGDESSRDSVCVEDVKVDALGNKVAMVRYLAPFYVVAPGDTLEETTYLLTGTVNGTKYLESLNQISFPPDLSGVARVYTATIPKREDFETRLSLIQSRRQKAKAPASLSSFERFATRYEMITCEKKQDRNMASEPKDPVEKWKKNFASDGDGMAFGLNRVDKLVKSKSFSKAESQLQLLKKAYPKSEQPHLALGDFYENQEKLPEAEVAYQDALKINSQNAATYMSLIRIYKTTNKKDEAQSAARELVQVLPATQNFPTVKEALGVSSN
jgi:hypothetical protein